MRLHRLGDERHEIEPSPGFQRDLSRRHPADVQEIIDEPVEVAGLAVNRGELSWAAPHRGVTPDEEIGRKEDGRQGISELVSEHREELLARRGARGGPRIAVAAPRSAERTAATSVRCCTGDRRTNVAEFIELETGADRSGRDVS